MARLTRRGFVQATGALAAVPALTTVARDASAQDVGDIAVEADIVFGGGGRGP